MKQQTAGALCLAAMVSDAMVAPFGRAETFSAWETIWAVCLNTAVITGLALLLLRHKNAQKAGKVWYATAGAALLLASACAFLDAERFYRFCSDEPLPATLTLAVLLLIALYALRCGTQTLARTAEILLWLLAGSLVLLALANTGKMQVTNLQHAWQTADGFWRACFVYFRFPAALLLFCLVPDGEDKGAPAMRPKTLLWVMLIPAGLQIGNAIMTELVLGEGAHGYAQASYTLARLGGLSVFRRLDALHLGIWLFALTMKSVILLCGASQAALCCLDGKCLTRPNAKQTTLLLLVLLVGMGIMAGVSADIRQVSVSVLAVLGACILFVRGRSAA